MIEKSVSTLLAVAPVLKSSAERFQQHIVDADAAQARGYYLPDEDERLREVYAQYLEIRAALVDVVEMMEPHAMGEMPLDPEERLKVFAVGFTAACFTIRSGMFLIELVDGRKVVRRKLDEAEPRYGIERKSFTEIYRLQSSVRRMWRFHEAWRFYDDHREEIMNLGDHSTLGPIISLLIEEEPFMQTRRRHYWKHRIRYRIHSIRRRNRSTYEQSMAQILELGGRTVSEFRDPTVSLKPLPKRALQTLEAAHQLLDPGDIIITRHADALTNRFLPGFWPHGAIIVGELGKGNGEVMEALKDGVRLRLLAETLSVDAYIVLRSKEERAIREEAAMRALSHRGKLYDFSFDYTQADRLACTALIYRSWHSLGEVSFELLEESGRLCIPAESLVEQALEKNNFEVVGYFGPDCKSLNVGTTAKEKFEAQFYAKRES